jgi:hypothetical protein
MKRNSLRTQLEILEKQKKPFMLEKRKYELETDRLDEFVRKLKLEIKKGNISISKAKIEKIGKVRNSLANLIMKNYYKIREIEEVQEGIIESYEKLDNSCRISSPKKAKKRRSINRK